MKKKKIAIIVSKHKYSFLNRLSLINYLDKKFNLTIFIPYENDLLNHYKKKYNLIPFQCSRNYFFILFDLFYFILLYKKILKEDYDYILNFSTKPVFLFSLVSKLNIKKIKIINTFTGLGRFFKNNNFQFLKKIIFKICFSKEQVLVFQNNNNRKLVSNYLDINKFKVKIIPGSGVSIKNDYKLNKNKFCCFVGRLNEDKGIIELIRAFIKFVKDDESAELNIAGPYDFKFSKNKKIFNELINSCKNIHYHGEITNVRNFISGYKFLILPTLHEGLPKVLLDAMVVQTACITTSWDGVSNLIDKYESRLIIDLSGNLIENIYNYFKKINEINDLEYYEIIKYYKDKVISKYSRDTINNKYYSLIK